MSLTATVIDRAVPGAAVMAVVKLQPAANDYATGGYAYTPATFNLSQIDWIIPGQRAKGYMLVVDYTNAKLVVYSLATAAEVANGTDLSAIALDVLVKGR